MTKTGVAKLELYVTCSHVDVNTARKWMKYIGLQRIYDVIDGARARIFTDEEMTEYTYSYTHAPRYLKGAAVRAFSDELMNTWPAIKGRAAFPAGPPRRALYVSMFSPAHPLVPRWWSLESLLPRMGNAEPASLAVSLVPSNLQSKRWARVCEGGCAREVRGCDHGPEGVWAVAGARCGGDPHRGAQWSVRTQPVSALKRKRC